MAQAPQIGSTNPRPCDTCTLCCKLFLLPELEKPAGVWCQHCTQGKGCGIHPTRPAGCRAFQCMWTLAPALGAQWRPDKAGFVISSLDMQLMVDVDPTQPDAWRREPYYAQFKTWSRRDQERVLYVIIRVGQRCTMVFPETDIELGDAPPNSEIDSGYALMGGRPTPFARFVHADTPKARN